MNGENLVVGLLHQELRRIQGKNPSYSLRSFAKKLRISPGSLSGIMGGKLNLTKNMGAKILRGIHTVPSDADSLLQSLKNKNRKKKDDFVLLDMKDYHLLVDWYYFAVLVLSETLNFNSDAKWVAKRLGIQKKLAEKALSTLEKVGLLSKDSLGHLKSTGLQFKTSSGVPNNLLRKSHLQNLDLAKKSLQKDAVDECDFTAMTVAIDPNELSQAKQMLSDFRRAFSKRFETGNRTEVFRLCLQLFPLTKPSKNGENSK